MGDSPSTPPQPRPAGAANGAIKSAVSGPDADAEKSVEQSALAAEPEPAAGSVDAPGRQTPARVVEKQRWNSPPQNRWRLCSVFLAFVNFGLSDASFGALLPSLESYYTISYTLVSLVFLAMFIGYGLAAVLSDPLHHALGQRGAAFLSPLGRLICYVILSLHVPWPAVVVSLVICGLGNGITEGAWNAWLGGMEGSNQVLGILHGCYGIGCTISPVLATALVNRYGWGWWEYYYLLIGMNVLELGVGTGTFWSENGMVFREKVAVDEVVGGKGRTRMALKRRETWLASLFFFLYVGVEVSLGGWITTFMLQVRGGSLFTSGLVATGFWSGLTAGRMTLGFITPRIGERIAISAYLVIAIVLQLLFWLVPSFVGSAVTVALLGYFIGPMFPSGVVVTTKLLPRHLHVSAIGFSAAIGGSGGALLPFAVGAIAQARGVQALQPIVIATLAALLLVWWLFPRLPKENRSNGEEA